VFRTSIGTIPARVPYLHVDASALDGCKMKVGLVWRGGDWDPRRDVPFDTLTQLTELQGISFYPLQQEPTAVEHHESFQTVLPRGADALTTARIMRGLDLIISIDSMPAHLAGALAVPTWTVLQENADWRWMRDRTDSPWYPTMRLFRQQEAGDWQPVVAQVKQKLQELL
jgi:ADP-heptose:LPS heptosyltransferase